MKKQENPDVEVVDADDPDIGMPAPEERGWRYYAAKHGFTSLGGKSAGGFRRRWGSGWQGHRPYSTDFMGPGRATGDFYSRFKVTRGRFKSGTSRLYRKAAETVLEAIGDRALMEGKGEIAAGEILRQEGEWTSSKDDAALREEVRRVAETMENSTDETIRRKREKSRTSIVHAASLARHIVNTAIATVDTKKENPEWKPDLESELSNRVQRDQSPQGDTGRMSLDQMAKEVQKHVKGNNPGAGLFSNRGDEEGKLGTGRGTEGGSVGTSMTEAEAETEAGVFAALVQTGGAEIRILGELIPHFRGRERFRGREALTGVPVGMTRTRELEMVEEESLCRFLRKDRDVVGEYIERGLLGFRQVDYTPQVQGDFTIMVDVSGSMRSILWAARVVTAAVCAAAIDDGRKVHMYPFNTGISLSHHVEIDPAVPKSPLLILAELSHTLNQAFGGGTDLNHCIMMGKDYNYPGLENDDDLFIITDGRDQHKGPDYGQDWGEELDPLFSHPGKVVFCHLVHTGDVSVEESVEIFLDQYRYNHYGDTIEELAENADLRKASFYGDVGSMVLLQHMWQDMRKSSFGYFAADVGLSGDEFVEQLVKAADAALDVND